MATNTGAKFQDRREASMAARQAMLERFKSRPAANDPDFQANLALFRFRFPVQCSHDAAVAEIAAFVDSRCEKLCGARFESRKVRISLEAALRECWLLADDFV